MIACGLQAIFQRSFCKHAPGTAGQKNREMLSLAVVAGALLLRLGSAAPPRAPARGGIKLSSCPKGRLEPRRGARRQRGGDRDICSRLRNHRVLRKRQHVRRASRRERPRRRFPQEGPSEHRRCDEVVAPALQKLRRGGVYADAFVSETIKGAATAELVANKFQAGGVHALHAIEQPVTGTTMPFAAPDATKGVRLGLPVRRHHARHHDVHGPGRDQGRRRRRRSGPELPWADFLVPLPGTRFGGSAAQ